MHITAVYTQYIENTQYTVHVQTNGVRLSRTAVLVPPFQIHCSSLEKWFSSNLCFKPPTKAQTGCSFNEATARVEQTAFQSHGCQCPLWHHKYTGFMPHFVKKRKKPNQKKRERKKRKSSFLFGWIWLETLVSKCRMYQAEPLTFLRPFFGPMSKRSLKCNSACCRTGTSNHGDHKSAF